MASNPIEESSTVEKRWATIRLWFGGLQTSAATAGLVCLLVTGVSYTTVLIVFGTLGVSALSLLLWGRRPNNIPFHWMSRK